MTNRRTPAPAPRWPTLVALIAAVLGVHLALLLGPVPWTWAAAVSTPAPATTTATPSPDLREAASPARPTSQQAVAAVSTVRWIVPAPDGALTAARVAAPLPRTARPPAPKPQAQATSARAAQEPAVGAATAKDGVTATTEPPATEPVALAEPVDPGTAPAPVPTPVSVQASPNEPPASPDDELLAAAGANKRATSPSATAARVLPPAQVAGSTRLDYAVTGRIKGMAYNAEGQLDWTVADGRYSARMEMKVFLLGSRVQTSTGRVGPAGLSPERFADKSRSEKAAHFDSEQNRVRFSNNAPEAVLLPGAQDRLSLFLQIAGLLQARPEAYASGQTLEMQVVGAGDADIWRFKVGDESTLTLPAGEMRVRQLVRLPRKEFDSTVEMWMAPDLQYLPVRLRVTQANGDVADQQLSRKP